MQPGRQASERAVDALEQVFALSPDVLILGGDMVMASAGASLEKVNENWRLWKECLSGFPPITTIACIGNQDIWGWNTADSGCDGTEPLFGKQMPLSQLGLDSAYYVEQVGGWRFIVLDSIMRGGNYGYIPRLDAEQRLWLSRQLEEDAETPTVVTAHVPLLPGPGSVFGSLTTEPRPDGKWQFPDTYNHADGFDIASELARYPNVKLFLGGHLHAYERIEFGGIVQISSAAISGAWWRGPFLNCPPGFTVIDLEDDGTFSARSEVTEPLSSS